MRRRPPESTRTDTLFPYTTLFRSMASGSQRTFRTGRTSHRLALLFAPRLTVPAGGTSMAERPMKQAAAEWEACRDAAAGCRRRHLYQNSTQTVFGHGSVSRSEKRRIGKEGVRTVIYCGQPYMKTK